jgi:hypothetical protein
MRIRVDAPKLSVLVSSTEQQMRKVLSADETENGLMSRFLFYVVHNDNTWYNGFESNVRTDPAFILTSRLSTQRWFEYLFKEDKNYEISGEAQAMHQSFFNHINDNWPEELQEIISLIRRSGTTCIRLAMLFEELFQLDNPVAESKGLKMRINYITASSMALAIDVMKVLIQHLFVAWQTTYRTEDFKETNVQDGTTRKAVVDALTRNPTGGYRVIAKELGISRELARHHVKSIKKEVDKKKKGQAQINATNKVINELGKGVSKK